MNIIVTGGRDFEDYTAFKKVMDLFHELRTVVRVAQGGARGADQMAIRWATENGVECVTYQPDWQTRGRRAGLDRNGDMLAAEILLDPFVQLVATPGGNGTKDMIWRAHQANILVHELIYVDGRDGFAEPMLVPKLKGVLVTETLSGPGACGICVARWIVRSTG